MRLFLALIPLLGLAQPSLQTYSISTWAGTTWSGDGRAATAAVLLQARGIVGDAEGNLFLSDAADHRIRRIAKNGIITTVAGTGRPGFTGESEPALKSPLNSPYGLALDPQGNLYIADLANARIRKLGVDGRLLTVAGGGDEKPDPYAAIPAVDAKLVQPRGVAVDRSGNVFIADFGANQIYQVTSGGMLSVIAGTGANSHNGQDMAVPALKAELSSPSALALDSRGALYIADSGNQIVRKLQAGVIAPVKDQKGVEISFGTVTGVTLDHADRLYVATGDEVTLVQNTGAYEKLAINGYAVSVSLQLDVYTAADRQILRLAGTRSEAIAGSIKGPGAGDGLEKDQWRFAWPAAIVRDVGGHVLISDKLNGRVRRISPAGELTTVTTKLKSPGAMALDKDSRLHVADTLGGCIYRVDLSGAVTCIYEQSVVRPMKVSAMAFDKAGNLFIADISSNMIHRLTPEGSLTVAAGGGPSPEDGPALLVSDPDT